MCALWRVLAETCGKDMYPGNIHLGHDSTVMAHTGESELSSMSRKVHWHQQMLIKPSWCEIRSDNYDAGTVIRVRMPGTRHRVFDDVPVAEYPFEWSPNEVDNEVSRIHRQGIAEWLRSWTNPCSDKILPPPPVPLKYPSSDNTHLKRTICYRLQL